MGMKQRLGIGVALLAKPDFMLLDEPINGLDPHGTVEVRNLILRLNKEQNITVLISSHILDELSKIATCYGIIDKGILTEEISAGELKNKCSSYAELKVDSVEKAITVLENVFHITNYKTESESVVKIFDLSIKASDINRLMVQNQVVVDSIITKSASLEDYVLGLNKGKNQNA